MPVLVTMAAIAYFRGDRVGSAPFFDPETLRETLIDGLEGVADDELARSLEITGQLESAIERYRGSVEESLEAYVEELADPETNAADLNARLETHDRERIELMAFIIESRERLLDTLDDEQWDRVFG